MGSTSEARPTAIQVDDNNFAGNFVGITLDSSTGSTIDASLLGNTFTSPGPMTIGTANPVGILAIGGGLTATIGQGNTLQNYIPAPTSMNRRATPRARIPAVPT